MLRESEVVWAYIQTNFPEVTVGIPTKPSGYPHYDAKKTAEVMRRISYEPNTALLGGMEGFRVRTLMGGNRPQAYLDACAEMIVSDGPAFNHLIDALKAYNPNPTVTVEEIVKVNQEPLEPLEAVAEEPVFEPPLDSDLLTEITNELSSDRFKGDTPDTGSW